MSDTERLHRHTDECFDGDLSLMCGKSDDAYYQALADEAERGYCTEPGPRSVKVRLSPEHPWVEAEQGWCGNPLPCPLHGGEPEPLSAPTYCLESDTEVPGKVCWNTLPCSVHG